MLSRSGGADEGPGGDLRKRGLAAARRALRRVARGTKGARKKPLASLVEGPRAAIAALTAEQVAAARALGCAAGELRVERLHVPAGETRAVPGDPPPFSSGNGGDGQSLRFAPGFTPPPVSGETAYFSGDAGDSGRVRLDAATVDLGTVAMLYRQGAGGRGGDVRVVGHRGWNGTAEHPQGPQGGEVRARGGDGWANCGSDGTPAGPGAPAAPAVERTSSAVMAPMGHRARAATAAPRSRRPRSPGARRRGPAAGAHASRRVRRSSRQGWPGTDPRRGRRRRARPRRLPRGARALHDHDHHEVPGGRPSTVPCRHIDIIDQILYDPPPTDGSALLSIVQSYSLDPDPLCQGQCPCRSWSGTQARTVTQRTSTGEIVSAETSGPMRGMDVVSSIWAAPRCDDAGNLLLPGGQYVYQVRQHARAARCGALSAYTHRFECSGCETLNLSVTHCCPTRRRCQPIACEADFCRATTSQPPGLFGSRCVATMEYGCIAWEPLRHTEGGRPRMPRAAGGESLAAHAPASSRAARWNTTHAPQRAQSTSLP